MIEIGLTRPGPKESGMPHVLWPSVVALVISGCAAQEKPTDTRNEKPEIVFETERPFRSTDSYAFNKFGKSCKSPGERVGFEQTFASSKSVYDLLRAPVRRLRVREYSDRWQTRRDVEKMLLDVLMKKTDVAFGSVPWAEGVNLDLVVTVEFSDAKESALEISGWHVCLVDHSNQVCWVTVPMDR
jgi:hypothetical protein